jgi:nucleoside-diphosphate-sugar epimerase
VIVAITGATGFIGQRLVNHCLRRGDRVRVLTRRHATSLPWNGAVEIHSGDLTDVSTPLADFVAGADVLYHCAGEIRNPDRMERLHIHGTARLIDAAKGRIGRWVQLSSVGVYGPRMDGTIDESTPLRPEGPYEITKLRSDQLVQQAAAGGAFDAVILRPSIVFGPDMTNRSLFQWINLIARRRFFFVGSPGASANYVPVESVVDALALCGTDPRAVGRTFNLSDWCSVEAFVGAISSALDIPPPKLRVPAAPLRLLAKLLAWVPGMPLTESRVRALCTRARYPVDRIERELDFTPPVNMEEALRAVVARYGTLPSSSASLVERSLRETLP